MGCRPTVGHLVHVSGQLTEVQVNGRMGMVLRCDDRFWVRGKYYTNSMENGHRKIYERGKLMDL